MSMLNNKHNKSDTKYQDNSVMKTTFEKLIRPVTQYSFLVALCGVTFGAINPVYSAENGTGIYLLGTKGPLAGILPPPGLYFQNDTYIYSGGTGASEKLPSGNVVSVGTKAKAVVDMPTLIWSTPYEILDGRLAFAVTAPFGRQKVEADLVLGGHNFDTANSIFTMGDPLLTAMIGWNEGNFHWSVNGILNLPVGNYDENSMANVAFHRWGADLSLAATWLEPELGLDISGVIGLTFNGKNLTTKYSTGTEFHFEGAISKAITPQFSLGAVGYYYQQISDDSSKSEVNLGGFRGRVAALGATATYSFEAFDRPVMARVKVFREFHTRNRQRATTGFVTLSIPLYVNPQKAF